MAKKVVFTGGHHSSALSVAREIINRELAEVVWFGHKHTMLGDRSLSAEYEEVSKSGIKFIEIKAGKLYKTFHPIQLARLPYGLLQAYWYLLKEQPDLVVSFGGYIAAPVVLAAWLQGVPIFTHEQTTVVGLANRMIGHFADTIFVAWPQSRKYFPDKDAVVSGLPLRSAIFEFDPKVERFSNNLPTIYITGGKQGSHVINQTVSMALKEILEMANVIHQTGANSINDDFNSLNVAKSKLPAELQARYYLQKYFYESEIGQVFHESDLVVSRAGAHTIYEIAALAKPALFVPIPWVSHNEQYKNARILVNDGSASILPEDKLTPTQLTSEIRQMIGKIKYYQGQADQAKSKVIYDATERITNVIAEFFQTKSTQTISA